MSSALLIVFAVGWGQAPASTPVWGLTWKAPAECLQPSELVDLVEEKLRRPVFGANPEFRIDGMVKSQSGSPRWKAKLTLVDASGAVLGSRDVTTDDKNCHSLDASVALVAAVMIDPKAAMSAGMVEVAPPAKEAPPPVEEPIEVIREQPSRKVSLNPPMRGFVAVRAGHSPLPFPSVGGVMGVFSPVANHWLLSTRVPLYPYVPIQGDSQSAVAFATGLGFDLAWASTPLSERKGKWLVGAGAEGLMIAAFQPFGAWLRADVLGRAGYWLPLGGSGLLIQLEAGYAPYVPTLRMVTPDGKPDDVALGGPLRWGVEVGWAF